MAAPPLLAGANQVTVTLPLLLAPVTAVGAPGTVAGVRAADCDDATLGPRPFVATTVKVYDVPFVNPDTVHDKPRIAHVLLPGLEVTV